MAEKPYFCKILLQELALRFEPQIAAEAKERTVEAGKRFGKGVQNSAQPIENTSKTSKKVAKLAGVSV